MLVERVAPGQVGLQLGQIDRKATRTQLGGAAGGTRVQRRLQVDFQPRLRQHDRADVAPNHHHLAAHADRPLLRA